MGEVNTILHSFHLEELRHIDSESGQQGGEDVHDDPIAPPLHLPVVVWSTHSQVSLHTHCYDKIDTCTHADPEIMETS